ncbi:right-handed parallel beta-helix repeat-containing protein [Pseudoalteromonas phenolica]|uniref:right-handed parallel beta-helix repeat-containing protein n=1 Tax=Pseudoalteromonas phenolica TaxID=161398 RepID=UPI003850BB35
MKTPIIGLLVLFPQLALSAVPNKFTPNTPAKATEVNANFEHLDNKTEENKTTISANTAKTNTNANTISENTTKITTNSTSISANTQRIQDNETAIASSSEGISANTAGVSANSALITSNAQRIEGNETKITNHAETIATNSTAISTNMSSITANETAINSLSTAISNAPTQAEIDSALAEIDNRLSALESADGTSLVNGKLAIDVDCTNDPAALQAAFADTINVSNVDFFITGNCYGDINVVRGTEGQEFLFIAGRAISISAKDPEARAGLIPNDETGRVGVNSGLSGGLYLTNIDIQAGEGDFNPVAYYRNGHGSVNNVTISGSNWTGILVQEGAQVYFSGITVTESSTGIFARSNAVLRFFNDNTINVNNFGIELFTASSLNQQGNINVTVNEGHAIKLESSSTWQMHGNRTLSSGGSVYINSGSSMVVNDMTLPSGNLDIHQGVMQSHSSLMIENGDLSVSMNGSLSFNSLTTNHMHADSSSSIRGSDLTANANVMIKDGSAANVNNFTVSGVFDLAQSANAEIQNLTVVEDINVSGSSSLIVPGLLRAQKNLNVVVDAYVEANRFESDGSLYADRGTFMFYEYGVMETLDMKMSKGEIRNPSLNTEQWSGVSEGSSLRVYPSEVDASVDVVFGNIRLGQGSDLFANDLMMVELSIDDTSHARLERMTLSSVNMIGASSARIMESDVTNQMNVQEGSSVVIENSTLSVPNGIHISDSKAHVWGENNGTQASQFNCNGVSVLHLEGWNKLDHENRTIDNSTNCVDADTWNNVLNNFLGSFGQ